MSAASLIATVLFVTLGVVSLVCAAARAESVAEWLTLFALLIIYIVMLSTYISGCGA